MGFQCKDDINDFIADLKNNQHTCGGGDFDGKMKVEATYTINFWFFDLLMGRVYLPIIYNNFNKGKQVKLLFS